MSLIKRIVYALCLLLGIQSPDGVAQTCQTASIPATTPTSRFTVNANGTVADKQTGLVWKQCSEGLSGTQCSEGSAAGYTWPGALQQAQAVNGTGFAGYRDWRLPNIKELRSLVERQCYSPAINVTVFPNTPDSYYWTSSPVADPSSGAWIVYFSNGDDDWSYGGSPSYVRLVRGGQ